ncbi:hypothetical protein [Burkholderia glumae]|nr:hypothetical protein [Burkholderia glumae]
MKNAAVNRKLKNRVEAGQAAVLRRGRAGRAALPCGSKVVTGAGAAALPD